MARKIDHVITCDAFGATRPTRVQSRRDPGDELELGFRAAVHAIYVCGILVDT